MIRDGKLIKGVIDKKSIGAGQPESVLHRLIKDYGTDAGRDYIDRAFKLFLAYIDSRGLTIGSTTRSSLQRQRRRFLR